jgi:ferritin-like metal-binding protein YciE
MNNELHRLFVNEIKEIYDAEQRLCKVLPNLAKAARTQELKEAFQNHARETEDQVSRLQEVFELLNEAPKAKKCDAMAGLIEEGKSLLKDYADSAALEAALISAGQKTEHYEIASYGCLVTWADQMGHAEVADILREILEQEKNADVKLTELARSFANLEAENATSTFARQ